MIVRPVEGENWKMGGREGGKPPFHFIRRQVARLLRMVLQGDTQRQAVGSIKSLVFQPSIRSKKATMALLCQTLKYLPVLKEVVLLSDLVNTRTKVQRELLYVIIFDLLFGEEVTASGTAERLVLSRKSSLRSSLARLLIQRNASKVEDLLPVDEKLSGPTAIRYVRVNTLKMHMDQAVEELQKLVKVNKDDLIPGVLAIPAGTELYNHPLVLTGSLILQGKASCMPAHALAPDPNWEVIDACAAPGNKTVQLAALMKGRGKIFACDINKNRLKRLQKIVQLAGASNVEIIHEDFLNIDPKATSFSKVKGILLDPSCSGSGTVKQRLDHLLPSSTEGQSIDLDQLRRLKSLACFQEKMLRHALSFASVERVIYSTCSIYQQENEDVVQSVLPYASSLDFCLETPFPAWPKRGLPVFKNAHHLLRTEPSDNLEGFFIALFVKKHSLGTVDVNEVQTERKDARIQRTRGKKRKTQKMDSVV